ncbi:MAG: hypothetical protein HXO02_04175 [Prevotella salivae]|nr:hypothetical protein [Segatella salivae]MBF1531022.1 hypothetical protein [Segatella salivae]MBF1535815.1 hypothetical protein [Segatella salivae]MBF1549487.1 hypothetical protein [Segatella salivae]MBF1558399.1 hypothetical protein [Segatella salivae]
MYEYIDYTNPASPVNKYLSWFYTYSTENTPLRLVLHHQQVQMPTAITA